MTRRLTNWSRRSHAPKPANSLGVALFLVAMLLASVDGLSQSTPNPTWSETGGGLDMAVAVAAFQAAGTPVLVRQGAAGDPNSASINNLDTRGASLLVAWVAVEGADPTPPSDTLGNTWQALPVYANGTHSHGRFFYAVNPNVGQSQNFTASGRYVTIAVSAWSGMSTASNVCEASSGAANAGTTSLATGSLTLSGGFLVITGWASDGAFPQGLAVNSGFSIISSVNGSVSESLSNAYYVTGQADPTWSETQGSEDFAVATAAFAASGTPLLLGHAEKGGYSSATTIGIDTTGATLLVAWAATEGTDPTGLTDSMGNTWQALPVYSNSSHSHGRFFYAYNPKVSSGHTFTLSGTGYTYPAIAVSAWSGMVNTSAVYQDSTGAANSSTEWLASGPLVPYGAALLLTAWSSDNNHSAGLAVDQGFSILGSLTNGAESEMVSHAYLVVGQDDPTWSQTGSQEEDMVAGVAAFQASGTSTFVSSAAAGASSTATTTGINTTGANLLVAWVAVEDADPTPPTDSLSNTWQPLTAYSNGAHSHGQFFYACDSNKVGSGHTFTASGRFVSIVVSAWRGMSTCASVYQGSTGVANPSAAWLATGDLTTAGTVLLITGFASDGIFPPNLAVSSGFAHLDSVSNGVSESAADAYLLPGQGNPTWSETQDYEDFAVSLAEFGASGYPMMLAHAEAGGPSSASVTLNTTGATLLVAWTATEGADPTGFSDTQGNTWQALPVYAANSWQAHGRFFYAYNPNVGSGDVFTLTGSYPAIAVSAWNGTLTTPAVYQSSTGAANYSTKSLPTGPILPSGSVLFISGWASDNNFSTGLAINQGFTIPGSVTNGATSEIISHAYLVSSNSALADKQTATVTLGNLTQAYTGSPLSPTASTNPAGLNIVWTGAPDFAAGAYPVTAAIDDPNYQGSASGTFTITQATPTLTWPNPADIAYGTPLSSTQLDATASVPGTFVYNPPAGWVLPVGNNQTLSTTFTPTDTTDYTNATAQATINVVNPPSIVPTLTPAPNSNQWNNSPVTVSFTCTAGGAPIAICPSPQTVSTEGAGQEVSGTATDTAGNTKSVTVFLNIDMTPPAIAVSAPADMSTVSESPVTITGSVSDGLSGTSQVTCGGVTATLADSAFSCSVPLNVGLSLIVVKATDAAGNVSASKVHLNLAGTLPAPSTLTVTPTGVNMLVGGVQQFTAVDELGRPRTDATWTVNDTSVAMITTDSSPLLTAVGVGPATLTATVGSITGQTTVNVLSGTSLPTGTLQWSVPLPSGSTIKSILQATPSPGSPDTYTLATLGANCLAMGGGGGQQMWTSEQTITSSFGCKAVPDGSGGLLVETGGETVANYTFATHITDLDGPTGTPAWRTDFNSSAWPPKLTVGLDGTLYYGGWKDTANYGLVSLAADTGVMRLLYTPPQGVEQIKACDGTIATYPWGSQELGQPVIGPDGTLFAAILVGNLYQDDSYDNCRSYTITTDYQLSLLQIAPDGSQSVSQFNDDQTQYVGEFPADQLGPVISDGQSGALVSWYTTGQPGGVLGHVTHVAGSGPTDVGISGSPYEMVLGDNGLAYVNAGATVTAFNVSTGTVVWNYPAPADASGMNVIASSAGGGLVVKTTDQYGIQQTVVRLDASGQPSTDTWSGTQLDYFLGDSWTGALTGPAALAAFSADPIDEAPSPGTRPGGDPQHNGTTDPGLVLVGTQDCHKGYPKNVIPPSYYVRYPIYSLRSPSNLTQPLPNCTRTQSDQSQCYTVFEFTPTFRQQCGYYVSPCSYANDSDLVRYNEFDDNVSSLGNDPFTNRFQYFQYGLRGKARYGVKRMYITYPDGIPRRKQPNYAWNVLGADLHDPPTIDGLTAPSLAVWDGSETSCYGEY